MLEDKNTKSEETVMYYIDPHYFYR